MSKKDKNSLKDEPSSPQSIITRKDGGTIAYEKIPGKLPGLIFFPGLKSDMNGAKALAIRQFCIERNIGYLRFDYRGHGDSSGEFENYTVSDWLDDALYVIDNLTDGPQVLIGSSMGGWLTLLTALRRKERVVGLLGIAAAPDFTESLIWEMFDEKQKMEIEQHGHIDLPNCYDLEDPFRITYKLIEDGRGHLLLGNKISIEIPICLIHGLEDKDVPAQTSKILSEKLVSSLIDIVFIKSGDHRLSREEDLMCLSQNLSLLLDRVEKLKD